MKAQQNVRAVWFSRLALAVPAAALAFAGASKLGDPAAFAEAIQNFQLVPPLFAGIAAVYLPWLELTVAIGLWLRRTSRAAWWLAFLILAGFTVLLAITAARGIDADCGCFGSGAGRGTSAGWAVLRNIGLLAFLVFGRKAIRPALPV
jgi:hypothetical protein